ncbi:hypothetical protein Tco_0714814 [Tanacetum coccineum]
METTDKRNTYKDCIVDSNSAMSKACTLHLYIAFAACIASKHLRIAFADCICKLAFASLHLHIALDPCISQPKVLIKTLLKVKQVENKQREKKPRFNKQFL